MTKEEILAMTAEQLDLAVATKVMGHKLGKYTDYGFKKEYERDVIALENGRYNHIPSYSTDLSAAWKVFITFDFPVIEKGHDEDGEDYFVVKIGPHRIIADTVEKALCRAALLSVTFP